MDKEDEIYYKLLMLGMMRHVQIMLAKRNLPFTDDTDMTDAYSSGVISLTQKYLLGVNNIEETN